MISELCMNDRPMHHSPTMTLVEYFCPFLPSADPHCRRAHTSLTLLAILSFHPHIHIHYDDYDRFLAIYVEDIGWPEQRFLQA